MSRPLDYRRTIGVAALCLLPATASAQAGSGSHAEDGRPRLSGTVTLAQLAQRVPVISPVTYHGTGIGVTARWDRRSESSATDAAVEFITADQTGKGMPNGSFSNHVLVGTLSLTHARALRRTTATLVQPYLGMRLEATVHADEHRYGAMRQGLRDVFAWAALTLGPSARVELSRGSGRWREELSVPIVGMAQIPYINAKAESHLRLRAVTFADIQAVRQRLSYHRRFTGGWAFIWAYDLALTRQSRDGMRNYARQGLSTSISLPIGKRRS